MNNKLSLIKKLIFTTLSIFIAITGVIVGDSKTVGADEGKSVLYSINEKLLINEEIKLVTEFQNSEENNKLTIISPKGFEIDEKKIKEENMSLILDLSIDKKDDINNKIIFLLKDQKYSGKLLINGRFSTPGNYEFIRDYNGSKDICLLKIVEEKELEEQTIESSSQTDASDRTNEEKVVVEKEKEKNESSSHSILTESIDEKKVSENNSVEEFDELQNPNKINPKIIQVYPELSISYSNITKGNKDGKNHFNNVLQFKIVVGNGENAIANFGDAGVQNIIPKGLEVDKNSITVSDNVLGLTTKKPSILNGATNVLNTTVTNLTPGRRYTITYNATIKSKTGISLSSTVKMIDGTVVRLESKTDIPVSRDVLNPPTLKVQSLNLDGTVSDEVRRNKRVKYRITLQKYFNIKNNDQGYDSITINSGKLDNNLEDFSDFVLKTENGKSIANSNIIYDSDSNQIIASFKDAKNFTGTQDVILEYTALVNKDTFDNTKIYAQASADIVFATSNTAKTGTSPQNITTVYKGDLKFISAPSGLSYGEEIKLSGIDRTYYFDSKDKELLVNDGRYKGHKWRMALKLGTELTSSSGHKLLNSIFYRNEYIDKPITKQDSQIIFENTTTDDSDVNISENWIKNQEGPILKVKSGSALAEEYKGSLEWILQDVPTDLD